MIPVAWIGIASGLALAAIAGVLAWHGLRGGVAFCEQQRRFICPERNEPVECRVVQNVRTGQWGPVQRCSAFSNPTEVACGQECVRILNLGFRLPGFLHT